MDPLAEMPDQTFQTADDATARTMMIQLGMLDRLLELAHKPELRKPRADMVCDCSHATHWIFGVHYHGYPSAADNGYLLRCLPKSRCTLDEFRATIRQDIGGDTPVDFQETWDGPPPPTHN